MTIFFSSYLLHFFAKIALLSYSLLSSFLLFSQQARCLRFSGLSKITGLTMVMMKVYILITMISRQTSVLLLVHHHTCALEVGMLKDSQQRKPEFSMKSIYLRLIKTYEFVRTYLNQYHWFAPFSPDSISVILEGYRTLVDYPLF